MTGFRCGILAIANFALVVALSGCTPDDSPEPSNGSSTDWPTELVTPIVGGSFSLGPRHLPGAPLEYHNGLHQGFDFVNGTAGRPSANDEQVAAVADGEILRIDHDYVESAPEVLKHWATLAAEPGFVGAHALDRLRGRQLWVRHEGGHMV